MNAKQILVIITTAGTLFAALPLEAHRTPHQSRHAARAEKLELSQSQRDALKQIRDQSRTEMKELREELSTKAQEYRRIRASNPQSASALRSEIVELRQEIGILRHAARAEARKVLTADQRSKLDARREQRKGK